MSYGDLVFFGGIALTGVSLLVFIIGTAVYGARRNSIKKKLTDKYGF